MLKVCLHIADCSVKIVDLQICIHLYSLSLKKNYIVLYDVILLSLVCSIVLRVRIKMMMMIDIS